MIRGTKKSLNPIDTVSTTEVLIVCVRIGTRLLLTRGGIAASSFVFNLVVISLSAAPATLISIAVPTKQPKVAPTTKEQ